MTYGTVQELAVIDIADPGIPNKERIAIRPKQAVDLYDFLFIIGWRTGEAGGIVPFDVYYPGQRIIQPPSWVIIFTGSGTNRTEVAPNGEVLHIFYMGRPRTLFAPGVAAGIVKVAAVTIGQPVKPPAQVTQQ